MLGRVAAVVGQFFGVPVAADQRPVVPGPAGVGGHPGPVVVAVAFGPGAGARLLKPMGVAVGAAGSIAIADTGNGLIRIVTG